MTKRFAERVTYGRIRGMKPKGAKYSDMNDPSCLDEFWLRFYLTDAVNRGSNIMRAILSQMHSFQNAPNTIQIFLNEATTFKKPRVVLKFFLFKQQSLKDDQTFRTPQPPTMLNLLLPPVSDAIPARQ
ncbi:unnamed protein product [Enterobius vermicularis]|uniref:DDE_Tnp_1_7 domain-containing protein n=1 Tax=Enterobius vermicularis TaxID=51028 RepID=A0A0N4V7Q0_ENTVE|nr:unnamed protein product [Enterobius vermicularis]